MAHTAEKYRDGGEVNKTEVEDENRLENYCVNAEEYRDDDKANKARINDENIVVEKVP